MTTAGNSSTPPAFVSTTIKILSQPMTGRNNMHLLLIYEKEGTIVQALVHADKINLLNVGEFYFIKRMKKLRSTYLMDTTTEISNGLPFPVDQRHIEYYLPQSDCNICSIIKEREGRLLSVHGVVENKTNLLFSNNTIRRELTISDETGTVVVVVWGEKQCKDTDPQINCTLSMTHLTTKRFNRSMQLHATSLTTLKVDNEERPFSGSVEGANFEGMEYIMVEGDKFLISKQQLLTIFPNSQIREIHVEGTVKCGRAQGIHVVNPAKKAKRD